MFQGKKPSDFELQSTGDNLAASKFCRPHKCKETSKHPVHCKTKKHTKYDINIFELIIKAMCSNYSIKAYSLKA